MATTLATKLQIKPGHRLAVLNVPEGYLARLTAELEGIAVSAGTEAGCDSVLLFVNNLDETARLAPDAMQSAPAGGPVWLAYPKMSSNVKTDVNRDRLWDALKSSGWRPVRQVAIDEVWSALRFRPAGEVGQ